MRIAYVGNDTGENDAFLKRLSETYEVVFHKEYGRIKLPNEFDAILVRHLGLQAILTSRHPHKNIMLYTKGVGVYEGHLAKIRWKNVRWLIALNQHQIDYFKMRFKVQARQVVGTAVLPPSADLYRFSALKHRNINPKEIKIALVANITGRKGYECVPELLRRFSNVKIYHLGKPMAYGHPAEEFVRWTLKKEKLEKRFKSRSFIPYEKMDAWYEDKDFIWSPSVTEGFGRSILEGMTKGLTPIVRRWPGSEQLFPSQSIYDHINEIEPILKRGLNPKAYRQFVIERYLPKKAVEKFNKLLNWQYEERDL